MRTRDRHFAVICFGVNLARSGATDASLYLEEVLSEAITTHSTLLIHDVLKQIENKGGRAWARFANEVEKKAAEHRIEEEKR